MTDNNLIERERVEAENLIERERLEAENIINNALNESKNILGESVRENENRINHAFVKDKTLKDIALIEIKNMKEDAKEETEHLKKMTTVSIEYIKNMLKTESDNRAKYAKIVSDNIKQTASVTAENLKHTASVTLENIKQTASVPAENLKQTASVPAENLKHTASVTAENLKHTASVTLENIKQTASVTLENIKQTASVPAENLKQTASVTAESLKQTASVTLENLKQTASVTLENLKQTASVTLENLKHTASVTLENLKQTASVPSENLKQTASVTSENLKQTALVISQNVTANVNVALKNMGKTAHDTKDNLLNYAKNYDLRTTKNTYNVIEQKRYTTFNRKLEHSHTKIDSRTYSFKTYFTVLIIISLVIIGSLLIYTDKITKTETNTILDDRYNKLSTITTYLDAELLGLNSVMESSSRLPQVQDVSFSNLIDKKLHGIPQDVDVPKREVANNILRTNSNIHAIFFTLPNGDMYMSQPYHTQENLIDNNFSFRDWYKGVTNTRETYISESYVSQVDNEKAVAVAIPVRSDGKDVGIFVAVFNIDHITEKLHQSPLEKNERMIVMDNNANIIYDSQSAIRDNQISNIPNDVMADIKNGDPVNTIQKIDGIEFMIIAEPFPIIHTDWVIVSVQPYHDMFAKITTMWNNTVIIIVLVGGLSFGLSVILLRIKSKSNKIVMSQNVTTNVKDHSIQTTKNMHDIIEQNRYTTSNEKLQSQNKKQLIVIVTMIVVITSVGTLYLVQPYYSQSPSASFSTNYLIQNLKGDTVDTWVSWKKSDDGLFHVHVQNSQYATKERLDAILDTIMSQKKIELDNSLMHKGLKGTSSTYYAGWYGALNSITTDTKFNIVKNLHFHVDTVATGDIMINLVALSNPDGYSAYTNSIIDEQNHQILKSTITVYNIDKISLEDLKALVRHELGHGFGLAHSTATEDLMAPIITTNYPYISQCDLDAITHLYDGGQRSTVICET